jgi:hypothetical protein
VLKPLAEDADEAFLCALLHHLRSALNDLREQYMLFLTSLSLSLSL